MKVYKLEVMVIDHDQIGEQGIKETLESTHYPNHCVLPRVKNVEVRDIGEWRDDHPLNLRDSADAEYRRLFAPASQACTNEPARPDREPKEIACVKYVAGFMFNEAMSKVALIRKNKPAWQAGKLNGIGGKVEPGETSSEAMRREFVEEAGGTDSTWNHFCSMFGQNNNGEVFSVQFFFTIGHLDKLTTLTDEMVEVLQVCDVVSGKYNTIGNISWLVALAVDCGKGVHPPGVVTVLYNSAKHEFK